MGLCSVDRSGHGTGKQGWEWAKEQNSWWRRHKLDVASDLLTCRLLPGQNYLFPWRILFLSLHYAHASKGGTNFFSSLGQGGDYPLGIDGNLHLRRLKWHLPSAAGWFPLLLAEHRVQTFCADFSLAMSAWHCFQLDSGH